MLSEDVVVTLFREITDAVENDLDSVTLIGVRADAGRLNSQGEEIVYFLRGPHAGHIARISSAKFDCGAYYIDVYCSCGASYANDVHGCWQWGHHREGGGDPTLAEYIPIT